MSMTREQLLSEALALGPREREALAEDLLQSLSETDRQTIDAAWLAEVRRRADAVDRGDLRTIPDARVFRDLRARLSEQI